VKHTVPLGVIDAGDLQIVGQFNPIGEPFKARLDEVLHELLALSHDQIDSVALSQERNGPLRMLTVRWESAQPMWTGEKQ